MEIINTTEFTVAPLAGRINFPGHSLTLIVKGTFDLRDRGVVTVSAQQLYPTGDEYYPDDEAQESIRYESDFAYYKPAADLLLVGKCHTPNCVPRKACKVTFQVGSLQSTLAVFGNRYWQTITKTISTPEPFTVMDLRYENSFGGEGYEKNPHGMGYTENAASSSSKKNLLPHIENIHHLIHSPDSCPEPAGFGPLDKMWQQRFSKIGTYQTNWMKERWPWFPVDFNWEYYNAAPGIMRVPGYLKGDETLFFENLHPVISKYRSQLPGLLIRCFLHRHNAERPDLPDFNEVKMHLDTLWVDMDAEKLVLVWRGVTEVQTEDYEEINHLYIVSEQMNHNSQSVTEHHHDFQTALAAEDTIFAEEMPNDDTSEQSVSLEEEIAKVEQEIAKAQETLHHELITAGIDPEREIPKSSQEDKETEAAIIKKYGLEALVAEKTLTREDIIAGMAVNRSFAGENFTNIDISSLDLRGGDFSGALFLNTNLKNALLDQAILTEAYFENADLTGASLKKIHALDADFTKAHLSGADMREAILNDAIFENALLDKTMLDNAQCRNCYFSGADLSGASLKHGIFDSADFSKTLLNETDFTKASLREASVEGACGENLIMRACDLTELRASEGCCFRKADFKKTLAKNSTWEDAELSDADFSYSEMMGADFSSAILQRVNFLGSDMKQARFRKADLTSAVCITMNLFEANLEKADLTETNFSGSNLYGAEFLEAKLNKTNFQSANLKMTKLAGKQR